MLKVNPKNTIMTASSIDELPENIKQFYEYTSNGKINYYNKVTDSIILLTNKDGMEGLFSLDLLEDYSHIDNEGTLWMGHHTWKLPSVDGAPLFMESSDEIVVIAPRMMPETLIVQECNKVEACI